jgi:hypothetical protein
MTKTIMTKTTATLVGTTARLLGLSLWVCMALACGKQPLQGGELFEPDAGEPAEPDGGAPGSLSPDTGSDSPTSGGPDEAVSPVTGGAGGGAGGQSGGSSGTAPPGTGGAGGASCPNGTPCGGDVVGTWTVTSSCLEVSGQVDLSMLGLVCTSAPVAGSLRVSGTWTAKPDGTYQDNTATQGNHVITLPASCLNLSGTYIRCDVLAQVLPTLGYQSASCTTAANGECTCLATVGQTGSIGVVTIDPSTGGRYGISGNVVTLANDAKYSYCVSADRMTWTLLGTSPTTTGTVVFQKSGPGGSGGSSGSGGAGGQGGSTGTGGSTGSPPLPCDVYASEAGPCVAAHSTVRALSAAYGGPLYQVRRDDGATKDIPVLGPGGFAAASVQDAFCASAACTISVIYDQSGMGNHLTKAPAGGAKMTPDNEANAKGLSATFSGHPVYGVYLAPGVGYRNNQTAGTATGDNPETIYMVADGKNYNGGCCFDYGNAETNNNDNGEGAAEAVYFGSCNIWGRGGGTGPWVMGDLENGLWPGSSMVNESNPSVTYDFVTAMVKGGLAGANRWTIKVGDAQSGDLATVFDGPRPNARYATMQKEGAIILGIAGDNSSAGRGTFFEGVMTAHYASDAADKAVQASIVSAYGR